jgi:hypothetical protein
MRSRKGEGTSRKGDWRVLVATGIVVIPAIWGMLAGCGANDLTNASQVVFPDSNVSFAGQVQPYLNLGCNVKGCHDAKRAENQNIELTSFVNVRATNVVNQPGDTNCNLVAVIYGRQLHQAQITANDNQRRGIRKWVLEGAKNN